MAFIADHPYAVLAVSTVIGLSAWTAVSRLFLHPLSKIPGPILARLSTWHECYYDFFKGGQEPWALQAMHAKYGPIVRPAPNEIHISDPDFVDTIYALRNRNSPNTGGLLVDQSVGATEDYLMHKMRRDAMSQYFTPKAVVALEHLFTVKLDKLVRIFDDALKSKKPLNLSDVFFAYSNDVVRVFLFGSDNNLLDDLPEAKLQRENLATLLTSVALNKHFPFIPRVLGTVLPSIIGDKAIPPAVMDMIKFRAKVGKDIEAIMTDTKNDHKNRNSIFYELRDSPTLPPEEKTIKRLQDEATLLVMAGTESTAKTMVIATFYCLYQPEVLEKLRMEITEALRTSKDHELSLSTLLVLPYINAIIHEANRLSFGVTKRLIRYSPTETLQYTASSGPYKGTTYALPPKTWMGTSTLTMHTNEELFPSPWTFDPERWLTTAESDRGSTAEEINRRKKNMLALGRGHRKCLGMTLATAEVCLQLAVLAQYDLKLYETDESDVRFQHDYQISHPRLDSLGVRAVVEGRHAL